MSSQGMNSQKKDFMKSSASISPWTFDTQKTFAKEKEFFAKGETTNCAKTFSAFPESESDIVIDEDIRLKEPSLYQVFMHNDDYTTMDFVVMILKKIFNKSPEDARSIMLTIHHEGIGIAGIYPLEIAETKVLQTETLARQSQFPLRLTIEEIDS